jgi:mitochondrial cardiolipin hydrolase
MDIDEFLSQSLDDRRFSRAERKTLRLHLAEAPGAMERVDFWCSRAAQLAKKETDNGRERELITWLYEVTKALRIEITDGQKVESDVLFSPGDGPRRRIISLLRAARRTVDCCVFTITDNDIVTALIETHERGVAVRIISDDLKSQDRGSDIERLISVGLPVKLDASSAHMHHKFALFDGKTLLNGSYNWTRSAASSNQENILVTDDPVLVKGFARTFESLWAQFRLERRHGG